MFSLYILDLILLIIRPSSFFPFAYFESLRLVNPRASNSPYSGESELQAVAGKLIADLSRNTRTRLDRKVNSLFYLGTLPGVFHYSHARKLVDHGSSISVRVWFGSFILT